MVKKIGVVAALLVGFVTVIGAITVTRVTVATTPTLLYTAATGGSTVLVRNAGAASVYIGGATVATTTGFEVAAGDGISIPLGPTDALYGIVSAGTVVVHVMESRR